MCLQDVVSRCKLLSSYAVAVRGRLCEQGLLDMPCLLLLTVMIPALLTMLGFFFGFGVSGWIFWLGIGLSVVLAGMHSVKRAVEQTLVLALACVGASCIFAYTSWDSAICHWPLSYAMSSGWNPVLGATDAQLASVVGKGTCSAVHMLCAPKFPTLCSALAMKGLGLFVGIGFLHVVLFAALFEVANRFFRMELGASVIMSVMAAVLVSLPLELMRQTMQGYVDYCRYTTFLIGVFSYFLWRKSGLLRDLALFMLGMVVAACCKSGALLWLIIALVVTSTMHFRDSRYRRMLVVSAAVFVILGFSPYMTEWIHNGSPFYPAHTYDSGKQIIDLCADQISPTTRNAAALRMGWLSRVVFAWISPDLAIAGCRWWYSDPSFAPVFKSPYVNGLSTGFVYWIWFCLVALFLFRNRAVKAFCMIVVLIVLLLPTRCIGFYRYTPEIVVLPPLCLMALAYSSRGPARIGKPLKIAVGAVLAYMCLYALLYTSAWFGLQLGLEGVRQTAFAKMSEKCSRGILAKNLNPKLRLVCSRRISASGIACSGDGREKGQVFQFAPPATFDLGLIPAVDVKTSKMKLDEQIRKRPIYFSYYNSLFSPFSGFRRWNSYQWRIKDLPAVLNGSAGAP